MKQGHLYLCWQYCFLIILLSYPSFAQQNTCDYKVEILADGDEFEKEGFKWRMQALKIEGKSTNITGTAQIEDSSGKTMKKYKPWTSDTISRQKTSSQYSPNLNPGEYKITAEINVECDDTDKNNNVDSKSITIKGEKEESISRKSKSPDEDSEATYRVDKSEKPVEEINKESQSIPSSDSFISKKSEAKQETISTQAGKNTDKNNEKSQLMELTSNTIQKPYVVYESSSEKAKNLVLIFLLTLSILLNIVLIWRR